MKWNTTLSSDGEREMKQHFFIEAERGAYYEDKYKGNKTLCSRLGVSDGERYLKVDELKGEALNKEKACKTCFRLVGNL